MPGNLGDYFWASADIAKEWGSEGEDVKKKADYISRKFKSILLQMNFNEEEVRFYKNTHTTIADSKSDIQPDSRMPDGRNYIFRDSDNTPDQIKRLFCIFKETKIIMTEKDRDEVKQILADILPVCRGVEDMILRDEQDSLSKLYDLKRSLNVTNIQEIINDFQDNKRIVKICSKIQRIAEEMNTILSDDFDAAQWLKRGNNYYQRRYEVERKVDSYYINNLQREYFEKKIFVWREQCDNPWQDIYIVQYDLIKKWNDKWAAIINKGKKLTGIEKSDIRHKLQECIDSLERAEDPPMISDRKGLADVNIIFEQCGDLVNDICRKCESEFKQHCPEAYGFIKETAFRELINIGIRVEKEQNAYCSGEKNKKAAET